MTLKGGNTACISCTRSNDHPAEAPTQNENGKVISHAQGTVQVHKIPSRIVVFDFGALDTMDALKVEGVVALPKKTCPAIWLNMLKTALPTRAA